MNFLIDYNLKGDAVLFWGTLAAEGWLDLLPIRFFTFEEVGLLIDSNDRTVWGFAQVNQLILITANRNMKGSGSLEQTIREENTSTSLPIITIGNPDRFDKRVYRKGVPLASLRFYLILKTIWEQVEFSFRKACGAARFTTSLSSLSNRD